MSAAVAGEHMPPLDPTGLYIHIPFCATKCNYCDFNTYAGIDDLVPAYRRALELEMTGWSSALGRLPVQTVFFGGGTPSYIPPGDLSDLMETARGCFDFEPGGEVSLEANPDDVSAERTEKWLDAGFNRVSMGVQAFDDRLLKSLSRRHSADQAERSFRTLRAAGFRNASLDLMFGLPGQSADDWTTSLQRALALGPDHISLYGLQVEPGTPLEADLRHGRVPAPDDDLAAEMYEAAEETLAGAGFTHYEISNWALPGMESRHNLVYWENGPYLGLGPGAHSSMLGHRFANMRSPRWYMRSLGLDPGGRAAAPAMFGRAAQPARKIPPEGTPGPLLEMFHRGPVESIEETTRQREIAETMMMGLRLAEGMSHAGFEARFGSSLRTEFGPQIEEMCGLGLLVEDNSGIRLTARGRLLGNEVFGAFVTAASDDPSKGGM